MTARWHPPADLGRLLDALEAEILSAADEEVRAALRETGRATQAAAQEVRALLAAKPDDGGDPPHARAGATREAAPVRRH